jgi:hypothetical protein
MPQPEAGMCDPFHKFRKMLGLVFSVQIKSAAKSFKTSSGSEMVSA